MTLEHGGNIAQASRLFGLPEEQWLDLSTGISPFAYPVPKIPPNIWQRLPHREISLMKAAAHYYRSPPEHLLAVPGSQAAIRLLPKLFPQSRIALPEIGYAEHADAWRRHGHQLHHYSPDSPDQIEQSIIKRQLDLVLVINPNNPSCDVIDKPRLQLWHTMLARQGGTLIVDEAFIDTQQECSLANEPDKDGLVILRSFGKFFGLAGARLGFVLGHPKRIQQISKLLDPWAVNGPAMWLGEQAFSDHQWQQNARSQLGQSSEKLFQRLRCLWVGLDIEFRRTDFFVSLFLAAEKANLLYQWLGQHGILIRSIPINRQQTCLRIGLTADLKQQRRFEQVLAASSFLTKIGP